MKLKEISIHKASTFKGFCKKHDNNIFESIDNKGIITYKDIILQFYRTTSKRYFLNNMVKKAELNNSGKEYYSNQKFENNKVTNFEKIISTLINLIIYDDVSLKENINISDNESLIMEINKSDILIIHKHISIKYPITLENSYTLLLNDNTYTSIIILIPTKIGTLLFILCHKDTLEQYSHHLKSNLTILNFIERSFMMDSEFYLNQNEFNTWSKEKKEIIEQDLYFYNELIFKEYDISIFDEIRKKIIENKPQQIQNYENNKIDKNPNRPNLKIRMEKLSEFIESNHKKMKLNS